MAQLLWPQNCKLQTANCICRAHLAVNARSLSEAISFSTAAALCLFHLPFSVLQCPFFSPPSAMGPIDKVHGSIDYRYTVICCGAAAICLNCTRSCSGVVCPAASASLSAQDGGYTADTSNAVHQYVAPPTATQSAPPTAHRPLSTAPSRCVALLSI